MKRVLIVDDDQDIREALAELFEESYDVLVAPNGLEALAILSQEPADAVVLDLMMPLMDGATVLKELHARAQTVPVVLLSASRDLARRAQMLGADGYCAKPCSAEEILAEVERVIVGSSNKGGQSDGGSEPQAPSGGAPPSSSGPSSSQTRSARGRSPATRGLRLRSPKTFSLRGRFRSQG